MANPLPALDHGAHLYFFLLNSYLDRFSDLRRTEEERAAAQMQLESFVLTAGPEMLKEIQRAFNVTTRVYAENAAVPKWFVSFVSGLEKPWLAVIDLGTIEGLWRAFVDWRFRRAALELITKIELAIEPKAEGKFSRVTTLFQSLQPDPFAEDMSEDARMIVETLLNRANLTPLDMVDTEGILGNYSLRVLRYCFVSRWQQITDAQISAIIGYGGAISPDRRQRFADVLLVGK